MFSTVLLFREALYGALVIAPACPVLGGYVVLRRIVFQKDTRWVSVAAVNSSGRSGQ